MNSFFQFAKSSLYNDQRNHLRSQHGIQASHNPVKDMLIPTVLEKTHSGERAYDLFSRMMKDRIIFMGDEVRSDMANLLVAQMLFLENEDAKRDITMYVNSPGGHVTAGLAIYDTMQYVKPDVSTVVMGMAASMGAVILCGGAKGKRFALPNAEVMIHQPLGGAQGQATDIAIAAEHILETKLKLNKLIAHHTGQKLAVVTADTERDNFMSAETAKKYGLVDIIVKKH
jgi:ATP-dependent Clp protease protease subunit